MMQKAISISKCGRIITKAATDPKKEPCADDMIRAEPLAKRQKTSGADASMHGAVEMGA